MTHEKNMIDYLDWIKGVFLDKQTTLDKIYEKGDFNKSQPKLGDFVPTNEKGEVMEEPEESHYKYTIKDEHQFSQPRIDRKEFNKAKEQYQEALDRRLWKGWEVGNRQADINGEGFYLKYEGNDVFAFWTIDNQEFELAMGGGYNIMETYNELITSGVKLERIQRK